MLVTLPALEDDTGFLMDLVETGCSVSDDKNLGVRIKNIWMLANLCDCLFKQKFVILFHLTQLFILLRYSILPMYSLSDTMRK